MRWLLTMLTLLGMPMVANRLLSAAPNVVMILADDLGYGDVQCYNPERGKIPTPHIDRLASQGMRFTDGHSSSGVCSPSRYALLTGRYHWRTRLQAGIVGYLERPLIAPDRLTIPAMLRQHGYATACVGKWHLGWDWSIPADQIELFRPGRGEAPAVTEVHRQAWRQVYTQPIAGGPTTRGFDEYFGTDVPNWPPYCFIDHDRTVGIPTAFLPADDLKNNRASLGGPALENWSLEGILPALANRACGIIRKHAEAGKPFFLYLPLTTPHTPLAVNRDWQLQSGLGERVADLIMETDAVVGQVLQTLEATGQAHNTLVVFTSDNGFAAYAGAKELERQGHFPSGPLRDYKTSVYEGGHRVPFVVRWPGVTPAGRVNGQLVHHADWLATLAEVVEHPLPANAGEDSFSLLRALKGGNQPVRPHAVSCASAGVPGLRQGSWKYIALADPQAKTEVQLYNLADDLGERHNLAAAQPDRVADMKTLLEELISAGRSTPGPAQQNDVPVKRYPVADAPAKKAKAAKKSAAS